MNENRFACPGAAAPTSGKPVRVGLPEAWPGAFRLAGPHAQPADPAIKGIGRYGFAMVGARMDVAESNGRAVDGRRLSRRGSRGESLYRPTSMV